jgi:multidrug resistance efflux pump
VAIHQSSEQQRKTMTMKQTELIKQEKVVEKSSVTKQEIETARREGAQIEAALRKAALMQKRDNDVAFALKWHEENGMEITPEFKTSVFNTYSKKYKLA